MHSDYNPARAGEIFDRGFESTSAVDGRVGTQLSQPSDVQSARDFFQSNSGQSQLPDLQFDGTFGGAESTIGNAGINAPPTGLESTLGAPNVPGLESAAMQPSLMPGLEQGALAGLPLGGEPISPLVQMILKMPGLTGIVGDFFSALMAFFFPADGGLLNLLDPALWAGIAQQALTSVSTFIMHDLPLTLTTMGGSNNPFQTLMQNGLLDSGTKAATASPVTLSLEHQPMSIGSYDVGGLNGPGQSMYEMSSMDGSQFLDGGAANIDLSSNKFIAMEGGNSFGPTLGGTSLPTAQVPNQPLLPTQTVPQTAQTYQAPGTDSNMVQQPVSADRGSLLHDNTTGGGTEIAQAPAHHVVERGDNLWNIAKENLGDGSRWGEIYDLNKSVVGSNPDLIFKGTDLKLPGTENLASGANNYVVQSGDNLWNISKDHLGGGQNWHSIYDQNSHIIGSNPDLIQPGQNLAIPDGGSHMQVAHAAPSSPIATGHHAPATAHHAHPTTAHHPAAHAQTAHAAPSHSAHSALHHSKTVAHAQTDAVPVKNAAPAGQSPAAQASDAGVSTNNLGTNPAPNVEHLTQEIGLKATAKSL
ncbi:MAG: LysM peptidoglycan-binding domain-containing protein [Candidatus Melainabacteria bacterium]|nr:LysM peptidoglycan-binding domain-containing protein [Candidatus Melainabacteria bacterium]